MRLLQADGLGMDVRELDEKGIDLRDASEPIVNGVVCREGIGARDGVVKAHQAKIFPRRLRRIRYGISGAVGEVGTCGRRPESIGIGYHRLIHTVARGIAGLAIWQKAESSVGAGHNRDAAHRQSLAETFVVPEEEQFVFLQRPAQ